MTVQSGFGDSLRPGRILVADPDPESRQLYHDCFESLGCDVIEASDGRDALTKALIRVPTLILTELWLPYLDGFALCEILRKDSSTRETPILIVTADARPEVLQHGRDAGADAVLVKPVSPEVIFAESHRLIEESRRLRAHHEEVGEDVRRVAERNRSLREASIQRRAHFRRETTRPPQAPPELECPRCAAHLKYVRSFIGGVRERQSEQWDYFTCSSCGTFQYRHRTGKVRRVP